MNNLLKTGIEFPYTPKPRESARISSSVLISDTLSYLNKPYANPILLTAAVLRKGGGIVKAGKALRGYLYKLVDDTFMVSVASLPDKDTIMSGLFATDFAKLAFDKTDILSMMGLLNSSGGNEGLKRIVEHTIGSIRKFLQFPAGALNDFEYCSNARRMLGFTLSNDLVIRANGAIGETLTLCETFSQAAGENFDINRLVAISSGDEAAADSVLEYCSQNEVLIAAVTPGRIFWETDKSGISHYSPESEIIYLGAALNNNGEERKQIASFADNPNEWIVNRLADIRTGIAIRYDYNKLMHMQMRELEVTNEGINKLHNAFDETMSAAIGDNWEDDLKAIFE